MTRITTLLALTCVLGALLACSPDAPAPVTPAPIAPAPAPAPDEAAPEPDPAPAALPEIVYYQIGPQ